MDKPSARFTAAVITVSDSCFRGERQDQSGPAVAQLLEQLKFSVTVREIVPDDSIKIQKNRARLSTSREQRNRLGKQVRAVFRAA